MLRSPANRFGSPRSPVATLLPACCPPVAFSALLAPCRFAVVSLLPSSCSFVAPLSLSCRSTVAILLPPDACCCFPSQCYFWPSCCYPVTHLLLLVVAPLLLFPLTSLLLSCPLPVIFLSLPCRLPVDCLLFPCRFPAAQPATLLLSCRLPRACLSPPRGLPVASLLSARRFSAPQYVTLLLPCCLIVACLSPACSLLRAFWSKEKNNLVPDEIFRLCLLFHLWLSTIFAVSHPHSSPIYLPFIYANGMIWL